MRCPECHSTKTVKMGFVHTRRGAKQRYKCNKCGRTFYGKRNK